MKQIVVKKSAFEMFKSDGLLVCPICGDANMHFNKPKYYEANSSYGVCEYVRGDVIAIPFWCEMNHFGTLCFGETTGNTLYWFDYETKSYSDYLDSDQWKELAYQAKLKAGNRCQLCNASGDDIVLHAHHRTYERIGNEDLYDITVLCANCHAKYHDIETKK